MTWLNHLAARAHVPVFVAFGDDAPAEAWTLSRLPGVLIVDTPRAASVLLVAGTIPEALIPYLHRLHDQLPHPRATVLWQSRPTQSIPNAVAVTGGNEIGLVVVNTFADLLAGDRVSEPDVLPNKPPAEWRGVGPHGQGGKGMMGGTPYGRPMAMTDDDIRDGLALDSYTAEFGPFLPFFPPGLVLKLTLQGDVIQKVKATHPPFGSGRPLLAAMLRLMGLPALAVRSLNGGANRRVLQRLIRLSGARFAIPPGLGRMPDGSDVRARFDRMTRTSTDATLQNPSDMALGHVLIGLEWHAAMLVLSSIDAASLQTLCKNSDNDDASSATDGRDPSGHDMHTGHMS